MRLHAKKGHRTLYAEMALADHFAIKCPMGLAAAKASLYSKIVLQTCMNTCSIDVMLKSIFGAE